MTDEREAARISTVALREAASAREGAGMGGERHDGGAKRLEEIVEAWQAGLRGTVPPTLRRFAEQATREADPEWQEFQRLSRKFGR